MLFGNCVRRINQIQFTKCLRNSQPVTAKHLHVGVAGRCQSMQSMRLDSPSMPHVTSLTANSTVFTNHRLQNNSGQPFIAICTHRHYSSNSSNSKNKNANARKDDDDDEESDDDDNGLQNDWDRQLPRFDSSHLSTPSIYFVVKNALSTLLIRSYFDLQFDRQEFLNGAKKAVQVVSNLLAEANFDELQDMVDDDTIAKMRQIVGSMTPEQRQWIVVNEPDIQWIFPYEIQFITKENAMANKSRFFVEIMVVVHAYRDGDLELNHLLGKPNAEVMKKLETNYSVANYRFIKEFTKGVDDDWTINYINHVKPTDEMKHRAKLVKES